jgi:hypothetical protein
MAMNNRDNGAVNIRVEKELPPPGLGKNGVRRDAKEEEVVEAQESKVERLLNDLGGGEGGGKVKVFRRRDGELVYCCALQMDDDIVENFEDAIGRKIGGGSFYIRGYLKGRAIGSGVSVEVDSDIYPPAKSNREKIREGESDAPAIIREQSPQQGGSMMEIMALMEQMRQAESRNAATIQNQQQQFMMVMMQSMENASARQVELIRAMSGAQKTGADGGDGVAKVLDYMKLFREMQGTFGKEEGSNGHHPDASLAERVLTAPLQTFASRLGDKVGEVVKESMKPTQPAPAALPPRPAPAPTQATKPIEQAKAEALQKPKSPSEIRLPPGTRLFKQGEVTSAPERRAPTIGQVKPTLVQDQDKK